MAVDFLGDKQAGGLSARTIEFYKGYLTRFFDFVPKTAFEISKSDIAEFINSLDCTAGGKHAYFRAIRAYFRWAESEELITRVPRMDAPKVPSIS